MAACSAQVTVPTLNTLTSLICAAQPPAWTGAPSTSPSPAPCPNAAWTRQTQPASALHYTDPATIERLIDPVIRRSLLQKWEPQPSKWGLTAKITKKGDKHHRVAHALFVTRLDEPATTAHSTLPAAGSGNFLYLALKCLKDVEHHSHPQAAESVWTREADLVTGPQRNRVSS